jgi:hypothetical protein
MPGRILLVAALCGLSAGAQTAPYEYDLKESVAPGVSYRERRWMRAGDGPFTMQILEVDPANPAVNLLPVRARDAAVSRETVSSMAWRYGATAAVNGGYFVVPGVYAGASTGVYQLDREALSGGADRSALLLCEETGYRERAEIDVVNFHGSVRAAGGASRVIDGVNRQRRAGDLVLYRPSMGPRTLTEAGGVEVILDSAGRVVKIDEKGNAAIPPGDTVLSGAGAAAEWLRKHAPAGAVLSVDARLVRATAESCRPRDIVGAGPRLVRGGKIEVTAERFAHQSVRHPRTAFAVTSRGTFLFVTLDGRQERSKGMRLDELAEELIALGATEAVNLDGGGSTTMVVNGVVRNSPSDGYERAVGDALLIFSVADRDRLAFLEERLASGERPVNPSSAARVLEEAIDSVRVGVR